LGEHARALGARSGLESLVAVEEEPGVRLHEREAEDGRRLRRRRSERRRPRPRRCRLGR
jgi:hypothetical protein